jgi:hypothetical protein
MDDNILDIKLLLLELKKEIKYKLNNSFVFIYDINIIKIINYINIIVIIFGFLFIIKIYLFQTS